jgi:MscS family membrane protein
MDSADISALTILIIGIVSVGIIVVVGRWLKQEASKTSTLIDDIVITAIGKPLILILIIVTLYYSLSMSTILPEDFHWIFDSRYLKVIIVIIGTWIIWSFVKNIAHQYEEVILASTTHETKIKLYYFFRGTFSYIIWFIAGVIILNILEVDVTPILAAGGIVGIAISFAAKDVLGNFFSGAVLAADQPFHIGDRIEVQTYIGDVISIGPRSTRIQTLDRQLVTIPNSILTNDVVVNYAEPDVHIRIKILVGVAYGTDINRVKYLLHSITSDAIEKGLCLIDPPPSIYFMEFGPSSLNLQVVVWADQYTLNLEVQDFINCKIVEIFEKEGIKIPFPQMDIHLDKNAG